jgi:hypothetical protein
VATAIPADATSSALERDQNAEPVIVVIPRLLFDAILPGCRWLPAMAVPIATTNTGLVQRGLILIYWTWIVVLGIYLTGASL